MRHVGNMQLIILHQTFIYAYFGAFLTDNSPDLTSEQSVCRQLKLLQSKPIQCYDKTVFLIFFPIQEKCLEKIKKFDKTQLDNSLTVFFVGNEIINT